jgi:hypothetical protein
MIKTMIVIKQGQSLKLHQISDKLTCLPHWPPAPEWPRTKDTQPTNWFQGEGSRGRERKRRGRKGVRFQVSTNTASHPKLSHAGSVSGFGTKPPPTLCVTNAWTYHPHHPCHLISTMPAPHPISPHHRSEWCAQNWTPVGHFRVFFCKAHCCCLCDWACHPTPPPSHTHHPTTFTNHLPPLFPMVPVVPVTLVH